MEREHAKAAPVDPTDAELDSLQEVIGARTLALHVAPDRLLNFRVSDDGVIDVSIVDVDSDGVEVEIESVPLEYTPALALWLWLDSVTDAQAAFDPIALGC